MPEYNSHCTIWNSSDCAHVHSWPADKWCGSCRQLRGMPYEAPVSNRTLENAIQIFSDARASDPQKELALSMHLLPGDAIVWDGNTFIRMSRPEIDIETIVVAGTP